LKVKQQMERRRGAAMEKRLDKCRQTGSPGSFRRDGGIAMDGST
jgi:hypothetical protein